MSEKRLNNANGVTGRHEKPVYSRERTLICQNSPLTDLFEKPEFQVVRPFCMVLFIISLIQNVLLYKSGNESAILFTKTITVAFKKFDIAVLLWLSMFTIFLALYPAFWVWAKLRTQFPLKSATSRLWDIIWLVLFVVYFLSFLAMLPYLRDAEFGIATATALVIEQMRMLLKMYAFIRSNVPRVLAYKPKSENNVLLPGFSKYLYFIFAPTLLYRDEYPRTTKIRWSFVFSNLAEMTLCCVYASHLIPHYIGPLFVTFGTKPQSVLNIFAVIFGITLPAFTVFVLAFYILFHNWFNACAEVLRFGDRLFYADYWNSSSFMEMYRKWNRPIYDFLQAYAYKDLRNIVGKTNKVAAIWLLFIISGLLHDYTVSMINNFYSPVLFSEFLLLGLIFSIKIFRDICSTKPSFWLLVFLANSTLFAYVAMEFNARLMCPKVYKNSALDFFMPRFFICNAALMKSDNVTHI